MQNNVLKNYDKELTMMILANIGLFIYFSNISELWDIIEHNKIILSFLISFISPLLITNVIPPNWKDLLIGYFENRTSSTAYTIIIHFIPEKYEKSFQRRTFLPGYSIFSRLNEGKIKNEKIKPDVLKKRHAFPEGYEDQNDLWYKIYRRHEQSPRIFPNYRYWLLLRDMVILNVFLFISITLFSYWKTLSYSLYWTIFMIGQIVFEIIMCRRYCNKYVETVLAEETHDIEKLDKSPPIIYKNITNNTTLNIK